MRAVVSARDFGGCGNAGAAASVNTPARSTIPVLERESTMNLKSAAAILALLISHAAFGADTPSSSNRADPMMDRYSAASEKQDWKSAAAAMQDALAKEPNNADYHN